MGLSTILLVLFMEAQDIKTMAKRKTQIFIILWNLFLKNTNSFTFQGVGKAIFFNGISYPDLFSAPIQSSLPVHSHINIDTVSPSSVHFVLNEIDPIQPINFH